MTTPSIFLISAVLWSASVPAHAQPDEAYCVPTRIVDGVQWPNNDILRGLFLTVDWQFLPDVYSNLNQYGSLFYLRDPPTQHQQVPCKYIWRDDPWANPNEDNSLIRDSTYQIQAASSFINAGSTSAALPMSFGQIFMSATQWTRKGLLSLYYSTNGARWHDAAGWATTGAGDTSYCAWRGVTCRGDAVVAVDLAANGLAGTLPRALFFFLPDLEELSLGGNALAGSIPADVALCPRLADLRLPDNRLTGPVPALAAAAALRRLDLAGNRLAGPVPLDTLPPGLTELRLARNALSGTIPVPAAILVKGFKLFSFQ